MKTYKAFSVVNVVSKTEAKVNFMDKTRTRYPLDELLAASDYSQPQPAEELEWVNTPAVGDELI